MLVELALSRSKGNAFQRGVSELLGSRMAIAAVATAGTCTERAFPPGTASGVGVIGHTTTNKRMQPARMAMDRITPIIIPSTDPRWMPAPTRTSVEQAKERPLMNTGSADLLDQF